MASDSGMMGGSLSHEFMLLTPVGEDSIALCGECGYRANLEAAECVVENRRDGQSQPLALTGTPGARTIEEVCELLRLPREKACKAVAYERETDGSLVLLFLRGDLEANETKVTNFLGCGVRPAALTEESGLHPGFLGPCGLPEEITLLFDRSLEGANNLCCGANREGYHYTGLDLRRELGDLCFHDFAKLRDKGICPRCGKPSISVSRGIEVGNIFQLGAKYTEAMGMRYLDREGNARFPLMGCYGIGIGRLAASVCEARHDEFGPVWPRSIAPWQAHLCAVRAEAPEVKAAADRLYGELRAAGVETLYDDRPVSAGVQFSDADLLGAPLRVVVSPRSLREGCCEISARDRGFTEKAPLAAAAGRLRQLAQA